MRQLLDEQARSLVAAAGVVVIDQQDDPIMDTPNTRAHLATKLCKPVA